MNYSWKEEEKKEFMAGDGKNVLKKLWRITNLLSLWQEAVGIVEL